MRNQFTVDVTKLWFVCKIH